MKPPTVTLSEVEGSFVFHRTPKEPVLSEAKGFFDYAQNDIPIFIVHGAHYKRP